MIAFCQWLQSTAFFTELRGSGIVYPTILALHMVALAFFGGMILFTDLRLMGVVMRKVPVANMIRRFRPLKHAGGTLMVICGLLLFGCKAEEYYYNVFFHMKIGLLLLVIVHGIVFRPLVYKNPEALDRAPRMPGVAKAAGAISLVLWMLLIVAGRGIGYIEPPLDKIHAGGPPVPASPMVAENRR